MKNIDIFQFFISIASIVICIYFILKKPKNELKQKINLVLIYAYLTGFNVGSLIVNKSELQTAISFILALISLIYLHKYYKDLMVFLEEMRLQILSERKDSQKIKNDLIKLKQNALFKKNNNFYQSSYTERETKNIISKKIVDCDKTKNEIIAITLKNNHHENDIFEVELFFPYKNRMLENQGLNPNISVSILSSNDRYSKVDSEYAYFLFLSQLEAQSNQAKEIMFLPSSSRQNCFIQGALFKSKIKDGLYYEEVIPNFDNNEIYVLNGYNSLIIPCLLANESLTIIFKTNK